MANWCARLKTVSNPVDYVQSGADPSVRGMNDVLLVSRWYLGLPDRGLILIGHNSGCMTGLFSEVLWRGTVGRRCDSLEYPSTG